MIRRAGTGSQLMAIRPPEAEATTPGTMGSSHTAVSRSQLRQGGASWGVAGGRARGYKSSRHRKWGTQA